MQLGRTDQTPKKPKLEGVLKPSLLDYPPIPTKAEGTLGEDQGAKVVKTF